MKANEAPEKIYLHPDIGGREFLRPWLHRPANNESVEYIRTDTFVEKVYEFFCEHLWEYIDLKNANCGTFININGDKLKEDFKKYMKGE